MLKNILNKVFPSKKKRLELIFLSYCDADKLLKETGDLWTIADEEDKNFIPGYVYLERLEK